MRRDSTLGLCQRVPCEQETRAHRGPQPPAGPAGQLVSPVKGGIVLKEFDECLEEVRNEDCDAPFNTLGRIAACRESDICKSLAGG